ADAVGPCGPAPSRGYRQKRPDNPCRPATDTDRHLRIDARSDLTVSTLQSLDHAAATTRDTELARRISAIAGKPGVLPDPGPGTGAPQSVQALEIAIDAQSTSGIRPFWKAVSGYTDETGTEKPEDPLVDPIRQGPAIWFQQINRAPPQRNRIHIDIDIDISVPHDKAPPRIEAAPTARGRLMSASRAPAF
ncbi:VOC family protein, partial [Streptomyces vietnamensis]|uniref:VOC family protein n=1 Tax=Streptomyces vietnamensis TaxID=362257 RepID=UPI0034380961